MAQKIKVQKYLLKQQLTQAMENIKKYEQAYQLLVERYNMLLKQARDLNQNCNMQALMIASMIKDSPENLLEVKHETMNSFAKSRILIDARGDEAKGVQLLTYKSTPIPQEELDKMDEMRKQQETLQAQAKEAADATSLAAMPECTDPNCTLPKELKHRHDAPVPAPVPAPVTEKIEQPTGEVAQPTEAQA